MSKDDDNVTMYVVVGFIFTVATIAVALVFAFFAFIALAVTIISFCAWEKPVTIGSMTFEPKDCHAFVLRGVLGAVILPLFALFVVMLYGVAINDNAWGYLVIGGYTAGSVGIEMLMAEQAKKAAEEAALLPPPPQVPARPPMVLPPSPSADFEFAVWDDEEKRS